MRVLMCPPDHYDVIDVKNPHMEGQVVDRERARAQWDALCDVFAEIGLTVERIEPVAGCEDMVFTANQAFSGPGKRCVLGNMRHASRQREVPAFADWFRQHGYAVIESPVLFEGGGDAVWHPGHATLWLGHGFRSDPGALAGVFDVDIVPLELVDPDFYHLDTCFCVLDERTVLLHPAALRDPAEVYDRFERVWEVDADEAFPACNAAAFFGTDVVIDRRAEATIARLETEYRVHAVDTGEFLKSGGSVYCLHQVLHELLHEAVD